MLSLNMFCYILLMTNSYQRFLPLKISELEFVFLLRSCQYQSMYPLYSIRLYFPKEGSMVFFRSHAHANKYTHTHTHTPHRSTQANRSKHIQTYTRTLKTHKTSHLFRTICIPFFHFNQLISA